MTESNETLGIVVDTRKRRSIERQPNSVDVYVGARVRERRTALGLSLDELATRIGVVAQQLQKYETGANRISASRLFEVATALAVPVAWFYVGIDGASVAAEHPSVSTDSLTAVEQLPELISVFMQIECSALRQKLIELCRIIGKPANQP
jgi:transcriptional regulator with XRE-family HTH domain